MLLAGTAIHQAQVELIALRAQEETLREHLGLARESELQRLREEQKRLSRLHGPSDVAVRQVQEQIARIEAGGLGVRENPGARQSQSLLESIEAGTVQPVFNLDVAEDADFFAGTRGALVHDNTLPDLRLTPFDAPATLSTVAHR